LLKLLSIRVEGFKNLKIKVPMEFPAEGNILVFGPNESGKSSLFEAVYFALFGKLLVKHKPTSLVDGINFQRNAARVDLRFLKDGQECLIQREISRQGAGATESVLFQIGNDAQPKTYSSFELKKQEVNDAIEQFIGFDGEILLNSCFVKQKDLDGFIGGTKRQMDEVIHKLLGMEKITTLKAQYGEELKILEAMNKYLQYESIKETKSKQIIDIHSKSAQLKELFDQFEAIEAVLERINQLKLDQYTRASGEITKSMEAIRVQLAQLEKELQDVVGKIKTLEAVDDLEKDVSSKRQILKTLEETRERSTAELMELERELNGIILKEIAEFYLNLNQYSALTDEIKKITNEVNKYQEYLDIWKQYQKFTTKIKDLETEIRENQLLLEIQELNNRQKELQSATKQISTQLKETSALKETRVKFEKIYSLTEQINTLNVELESINLKIGQYKDELNAKEAKTQEFTEYIQDLKVQLKKKELELIRAEKKIHKVHLNQINTALGNISQKNQNLMRLFLIIGAISVLIGAVLGIVIHGALFSIIAMGAILIFLGFLITKNIIPAGSSIELKEVIDSFRHYLAISPPHPSKFIDGHNLSEATAQNIQPLIENQIRKFDILLDSESISEPIENYYYHTPNDFSFNLCDEIAALKVKLEQATHESFGLSPYEKRKTELKTLIGEEEKKKDELLQRLRWYEKNSKKMHTQMDDTPVPTMNSQQLEKKIQELQQKLAQDKSEESSNTKYLDMLKSKLRNVPAHIEVSIIQARLVELDQQLKTQKANLERIKLPLDITEDYNDLQTYQANLKDKLSRNRAKLEEKQDILNRIWKCFFKTDFLKDRPPTQIMREADQYLIPLQRARKTYLEQLQAAFSIRAPEHYVEFYSNIFPEKHSKIKEKVDFIKKQKADIKKQLQDIEKVNANLNQIKRSNPVKVEQKASLDSRKTSLTQEIAQLNKKKIQLESENLNTIKTILERLKELQSNLVPLKKNSELHEVVSQFLDLQFDQSEKTHKTITQAHQLLQPMQAQLQQSIGTLRRKMETSLNLSLTSEANSVLQDAITTFLNQEQVLKAEISNAEENLRNLQKSRETARRINNYLEQNAGKLLPELTLQVANELEVVKLAQKVVEDADEQLTKMVLPTTRQFLVRILPILTAGRYKDLDIQQDNKGKFHVLVFDSSKKEYVEKVLFSGGTNDQIALAIRLAFAMAVMSGTDYNESFIFLDEPLGFFDDERKNYLIDFLTKGWIAERFAQRFVVSNFSSIKKYFDYVIEMEDGSIMTVVDSGGPGPTPPEDKEIVNYLGLDLIEDYEDEDGYCEYRFKLKNIIDQDIQKISLYASEIMISPKILYAGLKINASRDLGLEFNRNSLDGNILTINADLYLGKDEFKTDILKFDLSKKELVA